MPTDRGLQARDVTPGRRQASPKLASTLLGVGIAAVLTVVAALAVGGPWPLWWLGAINLVTPIFYWWDKRQAQLQGFRVPEFTLLGLGAVGGWPGGLLGRLAFHHKTSKLSFRLKFWAIVALHLVVGIWWFVLR
ncbi:MAG: DUF1294 domain-containing protein [Acidimicrobiales bacterium]